ncbi:hypothetical protein Hanom_Chr08g00734421 [Helianthus anomalus]
MRNISDVVNAREVLPSTLMISEIMEVVAPMVERESRDEEEDREKREREREVFS